MGRKSKACESAVQHGEIAQHKNVKYIKKKMEKNNSIVGSLMAA